MGNLLRRWFVHFHGEGEEQQQDLFRCLTCRRLVTHNRVRNGKMCCGGRVSPTSPTVIETIRLFVLPWTI
jgi:hypothetical protein